MLVHKLIPLDDIKSMCLVICMRSVLENKHPGSDEEQPVKLHSATVAGEKPVCLGHGPESLSVRYTLLEWIGQPSVLIRADTVETQPLKPFARLHGDTTCTCFSSFGSCSTQAISDQRGSVCHNRSQFPPRPCAHEGATLFIPHKHPGCVHRGSRSARCE